MRSGSLSHGPFGQPVRSNSTQRAALGTALTSTGATNGFFDGALDEDLLLGGGRELLGDGLDGGVVERHGAAKEGAAP